MINDKCPTCQKELIFQTYSGHYKFVKYNRQCKSCSKRKPEHKKEDFIRFCSRCGESMVYKTISEKNRSDREKRICKSCAAMMYNGMKGKHHSIKTRKKLSGKNNSMYGKSPSEKTREKLRIATIKWLESIGAREIGCKFYNKKACLYFSALSKEKGWNIKHAENGGEHIISGYSIDGYDENRNIVVEYDEPRHYDLHGNLKNNDVIRMSRIIKSSGCKFFRYNERTKTLTEHFSS